MSLKTSLVAQALILALRHADRVRARDAPLSRPRAPRHARRAADRAAARGRRASACSSPSGRALGLLGDDLGDWPRVHAGSRSSFAVILVAGPFYVRQAIAAFETVDPNLVAASRTLGAGPVRTFFRVTLPLARGGLIAGEAVALARGLGEFGATIMFAGSLQGTTQTLPLAIYQSSSRSTASTPRSRSARCS